MTWLAGTPGRSWGRRLTIKMLPYVGLAPVISALVARLPKKPVLIGADLIRAATALLPFITGHLIRLIHEAINHADHFVTGEARHG